jgi:hypothetical protein
VDVGRANDLLAELVGQVQSELRVRKKRKRQPDKLPDDTPLEKKPGSNQFHSKDCMAHGYIAQRRLQLQILHLFLLQTFGGHSFTVDSILAHVSVDLALKLVGIRELPLVFVKEPRLRFVLMRCLPAALRAEMDEMMGTANGLAKLLMMVSGSMTTESEFFFLRTSPDRQQFWLVPRAIVQFENAQIVFDWASPHDVIEFYRLIEMVDLVESIDPHSHTLWDKRYGMLRNGRNAQTSLSKAVCKQIVREPYRKSFPWFHHEVDKFVAKCGQNWINLQTSLEHIFDRDEVRRAVKLKQTSQNGKIAHFCDGPGDFQPTPTLLFDSKRITNYRFLKGLEPASVFNYLAALSALVASGLQVPLPRMWAKVLVWVETLTQMTKHELLNGFVASTFHYWLSGCFKDYRDMFAFNLAHLSAAQFTKVVNPIELSTSAYNSIMILSTRRLNMRSDLGELIERLKVVGLCPVSRFASKQAKEFLNNIPGDTIDEAVFYLKLSGFFTASAIPGEPEGRFRCAKRALNELRTLKYSPFYTKILELFALSKDPNQKSAAESTMSTCAYFLDFEADFTLELLPPASNGLDLSTINRPLNRPSMTNASRILKSGKMGMGHLSIKNQRIGLPNLPEFEIQKIPLSLSDDKPQADFLNYVGCPCDGLFKVFMQLFVVLFQVQGNEIPPELLLLIRLLYGFIVQKHTVGASLGEILKQYESFGFDFIIQCLSILEEFDLVMRIHTLSLEPVYVSDMYAGSHLVPHMLREEHESEQWELVRPHFWIDMHGEIDQNLLMRLKVKTAELIDASPGIEIMEIARIMLSLTMTDLLQIVDLLELDEVIFSVYGRESEGEGLFDVDREEIMQSVDNIVFLYSLICKQRDPSVNRITRKFYSRNRDHLHLAFSLANLF